MTGEEFSAISFPRGARLLRLSIKSVGGSECLLSLLLTCCHVHLLLLAVYGDGSLLVFLQLSCCACPPFRLASAVCLSYTQTTRAHTDHTHAHARTHARTHLIDTHSHAATHKHRQTDRQTHTRTRTHTHTDTHAHTPHTHAHTHTHTHTPHTHTHTHTHTTHTHTHTHRKRQRQTDVKCTHLIFEAQSVAKVLSRRNKFRRTQIKSSLVWHESL